MPYSWQGENGKRHFRETACCEVILDVLTSRTTCDGTAAEREKVTVMVATRKRKNEAQDTLRRNSEKTAEPLTKQHFQLTWEKQASWREHLTGCWIYKRIMTVLTCKFSRVFYMLYAISFGQCFANNLALHIFLGAPQCTYWLLCTYCLLLKRSKLLLLDFLHYCFLVLCTYSWVPHSVLIIFYLLFTSKTR